MKIVSFLIVLVFISTLFIIETSGQTLPIGLLPLDYNSSFAGSAGDSRISANILLQYQNDEYYKSFGYGFFTSYDEFLPKLRSGIGLSINRYSYFGEYKRSEFAYNSNYSYTNLNFDVAPKISFKGKYTFSPSITVGWRSEVQGFSGVDSPEKSKSNEFTSRAGLLFNTDRYYIGYTVYLFSDRDYFVSTLQAGYTFQKKPDSKFSFTPQFIFPITGKSETSNSIINAPFYNLGFRFNHFLFSINSQNDFSIPNGFQLGWQKNGWRFILSNEFYDSYVPTFSLRYIFNSDKKSKHIYNSNF